MLKLNISSGRVLEQLKLPVPPDEFKRKVDEIRAAGQPNIAPTVLNADSSVPALNWHLQQTRLDSDSTLQKLNQLAETIDGMNAAEHYHLSKSLNPESQQSLDDVLRIAAHIKPASLACYEVIPGELFLMPCSSFRIMRPLKPQNFSANFAACSQPSVLSMSPTPTTAGTITAPTIFQFNRAADLSIGMRTPSKTDTSLSSQQEINAHSLPERSTFAL